MFEPTFKSIDDILHKNAGCAIELDYVGKPHCLYQDLQDGWIYRMNGFEDVRMNGCGDERMNRILKIEYDYR